VTFFAEMNIFLVGFILVYTLNSLETTKENCISERFKNKTPLYSEEFEIVVLIKE
jgi:hypothetical protein